MILFRREREAIKDRKELKEIFKYATFPLMFVSLMWIVFLLSQTFSFDFVTLGIYPRSASGLIGILLAPLIHVELNHVFANTLPFLIIGFGLFYLYRKHALMIFGIIYIASGFIGWIFARDAYHIGASGVIYGMFFFLITAAIIKRDIRSLAFAFIIIFLYGTIVWGISPDFIPEKNISWEIHLSGAISGIITALFFRKVGPKKEEYLTEEDEEDEENENHHQPTESHNYDPHHKVD